jgi:hypothetical protein
MPIKASCQCGASFTAKDELAGKAVRCPKCKQPLQIPAPAGAAAPQPSAMDDLFDEVGIDRKTGPICPACQAELKPNAVLCTACGLNLQTGERAEGVGMRDASRGGHGDAADMILGKAEKQIAIDKVEDKKNRTSGAPFYVYLFGLIMITAFATMMFTMEKRFAFYYSGVAVLCFASVLMTYYNIRIAIIAFYESVGQGLLYLFVPFYCFAYWFMRWNDVRNFATSFISTLLIGHGLGWFFYWLGFLIPPPEREVWLEHPEPAAIVIVETDAQSSSIEL